MGSREYSENWVMFLCQCLNRAFRWCILFCPTCYALWYTCCFNGCHFSWTRPLLGFECPWAVVSSKDTNTGHYNTFIKHALWWTKRKVSFGQKNPGKSKISRKSADFSYSHKKVNVRNAFAIWLNQTQLCHVSSKFRDSHVILPPHPTLFFKNWMHLGKAPPRERCWSEFNGFVHPYERSGITFYR